MEDAECPFLRAIGERRVDEIIRLYLSASQVQVLRWVANKERKKTLIGSERRLRSAECLGFAPRDELKKRVSLTGKDAGR